MTAPKWLGYSRTLQRDGEQLVSLNMYIGGEEYPGGPQKRTMPPVECDELSKRIAALLTEDDRRQFMRETGVQHWPPTEAHWSGWCIDRGLEGPDEPVRIELAGVDGLSVSVTIAAKMPNGVFVHALERLLLMFRSIEAGPEDEPPRRHRAKRGGIPRRRSH